MRKTHSAGGVVVNPAGQILVVNQNHDSWSLPKGHLETGETPDQAARREIQEEAGITQLTFLQELGTYERFLIGLDGHDNHSELKAITLILYRTAQTTLQPADNTIPEAVWKAPSEVAALLTHPKDQEFFTRVAQPALKQLRSPA